MFWKKKTERLKAARSLGWAVLIRQLKRGPYDSPKNLQRIVYNANALHDSPHH